VNPSKKVEGNAAGEKGQLTLSHDELTGIMRKNKSLGLLND
jgi:hypothetical protein